MCRPTPGSSPVGGCGLTRATHDKVGTHHEHSRVAREHNTNENFETHLRQHAPLRVQIDNGDQSIEFQGEKLRRTMSTILYAWIVKLHSNAPGAIAT